jgi:hypothetical protein
MPGFTRRQLRDLRATTGLTRPAKIAEWLRARTNLAPRLREKIAPSRA